MSIEVDIKSLTFETLELVRSYLKKMIEVGGSDLHIKANATVRARINGKITQFSGSYFTKEQALTLSKELLRSQFPKFAEKKEYDTVYMYDDRNRFRVNLFFQMEGVSVVFRLIPVEVPTMQKMRFPEVLKHFIGLKNGLVLVTGATGSGKSTTLAAMINEINQTQYKHIITIEDPIEFVHKDKKCIINQRSVGQDTLSFDNALRGALREDPDIILVGEMRDIETMKLALHAADTGHLVFSTLHTVDAKETINRIVTQFPAEEQNSVRQTLANILGGVISQRLISTKDGGKTVAMEVMLRTSLIKTLIQENRDYEIKDAIEAGKEMYGSQSFDQHLLDLYRQGIITKEVAIENATSRNDIELKLKGINEGSVADFKSAEDIINEDDIFDLK